MSTLSKERLEALIEDEDCRVTMAEQEEMARELLALRKEREAAVPVAWISERNLKNLGKSYSVYVKHEPVMVRPIPLYTAPPAPVVPEAIENAIEYIKSIAFHIDENDYHGQHIAHFMQQAIMWLEGDACCAAMLKADVTLIGEGNMQAEPVSQPYKLPEGYVLVPVEPTEEMMLHKSGCQHHAWDDADCAMRQTRRLVWAHMLAAAPAPGKEG